MCTMEHVNQQFHLKIDIIFAVIEKLNGWAKQIGPAKVDETVNNAQNHIDQIKSQYSIHSAQLFIDVLDGIIERKDGKIQLESVIIRSNLIYQLDQIVRTIQSCVERNIKLTKKNSRVDEINCLIQQYYAFVVTQNQYIEHSCEFTCPNCTASVQNPLDKMIVKCDFCGAEYNLGGMEIDDVCMYGSYYQTKPKTSGTFNPNRHYQFWMTRILARESEDELGTEADPNGAIFLQRCRDLIMRDRKIVQMLTINDVRKMLNHFSLAILNKNAPLILKKLTGISPPQPSDELLHKIEYLFGLVIDVGGQVKREDQINRSFYPYYIYKIIDSIVSPSDPFYPILKYIYLQSDETLLRNDEDWSNICPHVPELVDKPTRR
jgi:hypothetical protein